MENNRKMAVFSSRNWTKEAKLNPDCSLLSPVLFGNMCAVWGFFVGDAVLGFLIVILVLPPILDHEDSQTMAA